jgi:hypothetical protein
MREKRNYKFTKDTKKVINPNTKNNVILYRIIAIKDIPYHGIKKGTLGGWLEKKENLSGENAWVADDACVFEDAKVWGKAVVWGNAWVFGDASVYDYAQVYDEATIQGYAWISDHAQISGNSCISGKLHIRNRAQIGGKNVNAYIQNNNDYCFFDKFGYKDRAITAFKTKDLCIFIQSPNFFNGSIEKFQNRIIKEFKDSKYSKEYSLLIELIKEKLK